ncbi:MAG: cupin domain-containing protein [Hyphomicrobiaceae bacterium]|nr:cupin domain-containing protein [Hyphomicrobiaceae bacterium]
MSGTTPACTTTADEIISLLGLQPHPEGGFYRETFRDPSLTGARANSTAIYFLLKAGQVSRWHRVDAVEGWHYYAGAPLLLETAPPDGPMNSPAANPVIATRLGSNFAHGERPQAIVATNHWQRARSLGAWTLVGCTVAPGFEFAGFTLAPDDFEPGGFQSDGFQSGEQPPTYELEA